MKVGRIFGVAVPMLTAFLLLGNGAAAHHSRGGVYESDDKITTMKGTVVEYRFRNPHVYVSWDAVDEAGNVTRWTGEVSSVTTMIALGMTRNSLKPGDEFMVTVLPARGGIPVSLIRKAVKMDGRVVIDLSRTNIREP